MRRTEFNAEAADDLYSEDCLALSHAGDGKLTSLERELADRFTRNHPRERIGWWHLGQALWRLGLYSFALEAHKTAHPLSLDSRDRALSCRLMARDYRYLWQLEDAERWARKAVHLDPSNAYSYLRYAEVLRAMGSREKEEEMLATAASLGPDRATFRAQLERGLLFRSQRRYSEAQEALEAARDIDPHDLRAKAAAKDIERVLALLPDLEPAPPLDRVFEMLKDAPGYEVPACARELAELMISGGREEFSPSFRCGIALAELGLPPESCEMFHLALERCPEGMLTVTRCQIGLTWSNRGVWEEAVHWFDLAAESDPGDASAFIYAGAAKHHAGQLEEAERYFRRGTLCSEGYPDEAWLGLGSIRRARREYGEALDCYERALELDPDYARAKEFKRDVEEVISRFPELSGRGRS